MPEKIEKVRPDMELAHLLIINGLARECEAGMQMMRYLSLLEKWNARLNLTSATEWSVLGPLFQESIWASKFYPAEAISLLDVGSGAGFPAVPIRILIPRIRLEMVESNGKKATFLETVVREVGLGNTLVSHRRLEEHLRHNDRYWDCISWKGLKLSRNDLSRLREHAHSGSQFWMFHGRDAAVQDPEILTRDFQLVRREKCVGRDHWYLSIYRLR